MSPQRSVLIVDESTESRAVLRTALERRGTQILEASRVGQGLELVREHRPDLIVLDLESENGAGESISDDFGSTVEDRQIPLVVLGTARRDASGLPSGEFVAKPYHYGPLIRKIECLLGQSS